MLALLLLGLFLLFFFACSCLISCSCFFTEGLCSGSLWLVKLGEELLLGEEGADGPFPPVLVSPGQK